eukprot:TRINITY_DN12585_c0_g1_i1.p1 TRINITY_DN12585_c0_g1~~TRINITY_DN12585_c0_g1_i1.p1  ORF type:complete len:117 (-),score=43.60 TRINITY_DN12585_c0_g1_i1:142-492(-)
MSNPDVAELACTYAALILHDEKMPVTADKIAALVKAANIDIPVFWPGIFARVLGGKNIDDLITSAGGSGGAAAAAPAAGGAAPSGGAAKEAPKEEKKKKEEPVEEEDGDMGMSLFD